MKDVLCHLSTGLLIVLLTNAVAWAQAGSTAQISGNVRDQSGAVLPGADVTVTQTDTGLWHGSSASREGRIWSFE